MSFNMVNCVDHIPAAFTSKLLKPDSCIMVGYPELEGAGDLLLFSSGKGILGANSKTEVTFKSEDNDHFHVR